MNGLTEQGKYVIHSAHLLKDAIERNKTCGFTLEAIQDSVKEIFNEYKVDNYIYPKDAGWIKDNKEIKQ